MGEIKKTNLAANPLVTVFVLNWNRKQDLLDALESVRRQTYAPIEMLVVDNGSTDGSALAAEQAYPEARIIRLERNYGCPGGRNRGIACATGTFVFFLDNDGLLDANAVEVAMHHIITDPRIAVVSCKTVYYETGQTQFLFGKNKDKSDSCCFTSRFSGGASLHRASIYAEVGCYPDDYMYGGEESDLALRLLDHGYLIKYVPDAVMYHKILDSARSRPQEFLHRCANSLTTAWRLWPLELAALYTLSSLGPQIMEAARKGWVTNWLADIPRRAVRILKILRKRSPVRRSTMLYSRQIANLLPSIPIEHPGSLSIKSYLKSLFVR